MNEAGSILGGMALMVLIMGVFISFVVICGIVNAKQELLAVKKQEKAARRPKGEKRRSKAAVSS